MNELWVARDRSGDLWQFGQKPEWYHVEGVWDGSASDCVLNELPKSFYPDLKPGECRRLVMESEASECDKT